ncbi:hypothetical protein D3C87_1945490 [compost metagenome]
MRCATGELDDLDATSDLALRIGQYLTVFNGDKTRELLMVLVQQFLEAEQNARASQR